MSDTANHFINRGLILLSNREPYEHVRTREGKVELRVPAGGLVSALDPILRRAAGTWVAWGSGDADRETADEHGRIRVPPDDPSYILRRVWLDDADVEGYYLGFANSALWPVCHLFIQHMDIRAAQWDSYRAVNKRFAEAVAEEAHRMGGRPMVWVQDYHFALAPGMIRERLPTALVHQFWHIPFPPPDVFHLIPQGVQGALLCGMLGNDLLEFQTDANVRNFLDCVERLLPGAVVDRAASTVEYERRLVRVGAFPISIDVDEWRRLASLMRTRALVETLRTRYGAGGQQLVVSVDRVDYTKGLIRRLRALEHIWENEPERQATFTVLLVATPSRTDVQAYADLETELVERVSAINARYATTEWTPIVLVHDNVDADLLAAVYAAADVCLVSSLQDGMNLVAKEFIVCQNEEDPGALVLSRFTGAADELEGAILVNPFFIDAFAAAICTALDMPDAERVRRMKLLREQVSGATIHDWLDSVLSAAEQVDEVHALRGASLG